MYKIYSQIRVTHLTNYYAHIDIIRVTNLERDFRINKKRLFHNQHYSLKNICKFTIELNIYFHDCCCLFLSISYKNSKKKNTIYNNNYKLSRIQFSTYT